MALTVFNVISTSAIASYHLLENYANSIPFHCYHLGVFTMAASQKIDRYCLSLFRAR